MIKVKDVFREYVGRDRRGIRSSFFRSRRRLYMFWKVVGMDLIKGGYFRFGRFWRSKNKSYESVVSSFFERGSGFLAVVV